MTIDRQGAIYVADWGNDRIQKFSADGAFLASYGTSGRGDDPGQLWRPSGVAVDRNGTVYVADRGNDRLKVFGADGEPLGSYQGESGLSRWAEIWLAGNPDVAKLREPASTEPEKRFWAPTAVDVNNTAGCWCWTPVVIASRFIYRSPDLRVRSRHKGGRRRLTAALLVPARIAQPVLRPLRRFVACRTSRWR